MALYMRGIKSIIGSLTLIADDNALLEIQFKSSMQNDHSKILDLAQKELELYFARKLKIFTVPQNPRGTSYQCKCWQTLQKIKYGQTISYKDQATQVANAKHTRSVAQANSKNPIPIIIPCHRVIASNGDIGGYAGGLKMKKILIGLEQDSN